MADDLLSCSCCWKPFGRESQRFEPIERFVKQGFQERLGFFVNFHFNQRDSTRFSADCSAVFGCVNSVIVINDSVRGSLPVSTKVTAG